MILTLQHNIECPSNCDKCLTNTTCSITGCSDGFGFNSTNSHCGRYSTLITYYTLYARQGDEVIVSIFSHNY